MNHLAHALVAARAGESIPGHLLGDFVKGHPEPHWSGPLLHGIRAHRRIDSFTDDHAAVRRSVARFRPPFRRWGGVLTDLMYDHILAAHWTELGDGTLRAFADRVYGELGALRPELPVRMQAFHDYMVRSDLLVAYGEMAGIARSLRGMARRIRRVNPLEDALPEVARVRPGLEQDFREFFPDVLATFTSGESR